MKKFLDENFLLHSKTAEYLYHQHAAAMPIIDYHCHLSPALMAQNHCFSNMTQAWLDGDHYKWRAMRANGIPESLISGDGSDEDKFIAWAQTVPYTPRNPLYHWTHLELRRYFGIDQLLSPDTANDIYQQTSDKLRTEDFSVISLLQKMKVEVVCTTDDPVDSLEHHLQISQADWSVKVFPTWRPDRVLGTSDPQEWNAYLDQLSEVSGVQINSYTDLIQALKTRHDHFNEAGCRLSDHGLELFVYDEPDEKNINHTFDTLRSGKCVDNTQQFETAVLLELARMDSDKGWTQQFHVGAQRNNNSKALAEIGKDSGFDSIGDQQMAAAMGQFFNHLESESKLSKTILYNLNPADNEVFASMIGNFQDGSIPGKIQWGSGWWFLDQKDGMEKQLNTLSNFGLLSRFVGMLTDSRSFLSYPRHEYFRRILCNLIGADVEKGELPDDKDWLGQMVEDICYHNAKRYFKF